MFKTLLLFVVTAIGLKAADGWLGTWKLDPSRSQFQNTDVYKDLLLVITEENGQHVFNFTMTGADGKVTQADFKQPNQGGKMIPIGQTPVDDGVVSIIDDHRMIYKYYSKDGTLQSVRHVTLSKDGKSHQADMRFKNNGKPAIEHEYMIKQ